MQALSFLPYKDPLAEKINRVAQHFYQQLNDLNVQEIGLNERVYIYFQNSHFKRQFFSVQTAAELLYRSITRVDKKIEDLVVMDYGAGVGSLYLLAKAIGCKTVIHADIMEDMHEAGQRVAQALDIHIDEYILGDHNQILKVLADKHIVCDLILSRNVVEHIYDLPEFYTAMMEYQPQALHYNSTTANFQNPAMMWHHKRIHKEYEKKYLAERLAIIESKYPHLASDKAHKLAAATRGLAGQDLTNALEHYQQEGVMPDPSIHYTNTCDPVYGVWAEHIIPESAYREMLEPLGYKVDILPAFWDTHYSQAWKNWLGKTMNFITQKTSRTFGLKVTAFIYVVLSKK